MPMPHSETVLSPQDPITRLADKLVAATVAVMRHAVTEEDLRVGFEKALGPLCQSIGVISRPVYEKSVYLGGRPDAIHGQVVIEYEAPRAFQSARAIEHAFGQLVGHMRSEAQERKDALFLLDPSRVGVGLDGEQVFFVHCRGDKDSLKTELRARDFSRSGPYPFDPQSARTLLTHLRALSRRLLTAASLSEVFGPQGVVAPKVVSSLVDALRNWASSPRVRTFLDEWKRLFGIVYGEQFQRHQAEQAQALRRLYQVGEQTDFQELLFAVHTYFVLLMKLIAAELLNLSQTSFKSSFCDDLAHHAKDELLAALNEIEDGGVYARRGITNFLEGDFFRWYLDAF